MRYDAEKPTPSQLAVRYVQSINHDKAEKLLVSGARILKADCSCSVCGINVKKGNFGFPAKFSSTFVDAPFILSSDRETKSCICQSCQVALTYPPMTVQLTYAAVGQDENGEPVAYATLKDVDFVSAMLHPPKAPFFFVLKEAKKQHMLWKSKVNLIDADQSGIIFYSLGNQNLYCRPSTVVSAIKKQDELIKLLSAGLKKGQKPPTSLFASLSRTADRESDFLPRNFDKRVEDVALLTRIKHFQSLIQTLSFGDRYFFAALCRVRNHHPELSLDELIAQLTPSPIDEQIFLKGN